MLRTLLLSYLSTGYWLWAGVPVTPRLAAAETVYLFQGQLERKPNGQPRLREMGQAPHPAQWQHVFLVYRLTTLAEPEALAQAAATRARAWERLGTPIEGIQLDFDAATLKLGAYADFLKAFRAALRPPLKLSITGLADWSANAPAGDLARVADVVDEVAFQLYRGRQAVPGWQKYAKSLVRCRIPFRIGLLESMTLPAGLRADLEANEHYRGETWFIVGSHL